MSSLNLIILNISNITWLISNFTRSKWIIEPFDLRCGQSFRNNLSKIRSWMLRKIFNFSYSIVRITLAFSKSTGNFYDMQVLISCLSFCCCKVSYFLFNTCKLGQLFLSRRHEIYDCYAEGVRGFKINAETYKFLCKNWLKKVKTFTLRQ